MFIKKMLLCSVSHRTMPSKYTANLPICWYLSPLPRSSQKHSLFSSSSLYYTHGAVCNIRSQPIYRSVSIYGSWNNDLTFSTCAFLFLNFSYFFFRWNSFKRKRKETSSMQPQCCCWVTQLFRDRWRNKFCWFNDTFNVINR